MIPSQKRGLEKSWQVTFLLAGDVFAQIVVDFLWLTGARYVQHTVPIVDRNERLWTLKFASRVLTILKYVPTNAKLYDHGNETTMNPT